MIVFIIHVSVVLDKRENKNADLGRFELAHRDNPHPGFKCVDNKFYVEGTRIRKVDLQRYSELDKKTRQKERNKIRDKKRQEEEERVKEAKEASKQKIQVDDEKQENDTSEVNEHATGDTVKEDNEKQEDEDELIKMRLQDRKPETNENTNVFSVI